MKVTVEIDNEDQADAVLRYAENLKERKEEEEVIELLRAKRNEKDRSNAYGDWVYASVPISKLHLAARATHTNVGVLESTCERASSLGWSLVGQVDAFLLFRGKVGGR